MPTARPNLVLGAATRYRPEELRLFLDTFERCVPSATLVLLVAPENTALADHVSSRGHEVHLWRRPAWMGDRLYAWRFLPRLRPLHALPALLCRLPGCERAAWRLSREFQHAVVARFDHCRDVLDGRPDVPERVLLTDVRDVVFQADPFEKVEPGRVHLFQENEAVTHAKDGASRSWIEALVGVRRAEAILPRPLVCAGAIIGDHAPVRRLMDDLCAFMIRRSHRTAGLFGPDQAALNWLYWNGLLRDVVLRPSFEGAISHLNLEDPASFRFDAAGRLLNRDGSPVPLLHQFDRHPVVAQRFEAP